jgi:hypothetical protein
MLWMMRSARCVCLLAMASSLLFASAQTYGFEELEVMQGSTLRFRVNVEDERANGQDTLSVILTIPSLGWASLAFNDNGGLMIGSEAVIGLPDTGEVKKYNLGAKGTAGVLPMADDKQTLIATSISQESGITTLAFTKILVEEGEIAIDATGENVFLSAYGTSNILGYHDKRESFAVDLAVAPAPAEIFLGSLTTNAHLVSGDVYLLSERILEVRNFVYDGEGPAGFFWVDTESEPTTGGRVISDGSPSLGCAMTSDDTPLPRQEGVTQRVEFPEGVTINDFLGGSLSVWCEEFAANFGSLTLPSSLEVIPSPGPVLECVPPEVPEIAKTPEGYNCEPLTDDFQVRWQVDGDDLHVELVGRIDDGTYMSFGISGRPQTDTWMIGADAVVVVSDRQLLSCIVLYYIMRLVFYLMILTGLVFFLPPLLLGYDGLWPTCPRYFYGSTRPM